jgi:pyruvate formate lyase activating enzyme
MTEVIKDTIFYEQSGGGVTLSGGEPLLQAGFLDGVLRSCRNARIHTALDTCGYGDQDTILGIAEYVDLFLWDLKTMDDEVHKEYTGVSNAAILDNLRALVQTGNQAIVRFSLVPGVNDSESNVRAVGEFVASLEGVDRIDILPYHNAWRRKYKGLHRESSPARFAPPSAERIKEVETKLAEFGLNIRIGG